ncbi:branched-chain amino acid aminotransferase [Alkalihalobacillus alcalophilus ATCC 27647 = CGMCC 1.3604]|uniref:Branched-chain-amino-acid aminotransferase n=2 Tax=Alkalihalobacillus alcalophilus ATCC 27647 = CGMCC 1.3604 TaxID=1218173 RepID=A0A4S4JYS2_ALKAL|nr:branched-chain amino acid aminotransferase [Alkalihalobacillus alcalophilus]MED1560310.1 branched-chain amino acid aminotransferase [Alkalihalobacillus alcalophilus]THG88769.1 branched-chain amino acid aminotransferase [Alkalihalobacillus alcalophilus ATCC 27647 = CGMCC 1.3604]
MSGKKLQIIRTMHPKEKPDVNKVKFGSVFTDHMFKMNYTVNKGWHDPKIIPYQPVTLDPAAMIFHYGQTVFEGLKAYRTEDDQILLFRPDQNFQRLNRSSERLSIPHVDEEEVLYYLKQLIALEKEWVPKGEGTSLYIRPFIIATENNLSVHPSACYTFMIILSPVAAYYPEGINPVRIYVEENFTRAVKGGTGTAKTAGNYSAAYNAQNEATKQGFSQVLWLDGVEKKYIEEVGSMNVFFKINGEIVTPALNGSILEGITRKSMIELLKSWDMPVVEKRLSMDELLEAYNQGLLEEAFGTGTAAVISPIGELIWRDQKMKINGGETGNVSKRLYDTLTGIQTGKKADSFNWTIQVNSLDETTSN